MTAYNGHKLDSRYKVWIGMKQRCDNPKDAKYFRYGAKGITYAPEWKDFKVFCLDVGTRPAGLTLDRYPDKNGNYVPGNVRWATAVEQANNRNARTLPTEALPNSSTGILGVCRIKNGLYRAQGKSKGINRCLYEGRSLEDACKARKYWEDAGRPV